MLLVILLPYFLFLNFTFKPLRDNKYFTKFQNLKDDSMLVWYKNCNYTTLKVYAIIGFNRSALVSTYCINDFYHLQAIFMKFHSILKFPFSVSGDHKEIRESRKIFTWDFPVHMKRTWIVTGLSSFSIILLRS